MTTQSDSQHGTILHTLAGTVLTLVGNIDSSDMIKTGTLAGVGAVVSFVVSLLLKWLKRKLPVK